MDRINTEFDGRNTSTAKRWKFTSFFRQLENANLCLLNPIWSDEGQKSEKYCLLEGNLIEKRLISDRFFSVCYAQLVSLLKMHKACYLYTPTGCCPASKRSAAKTVYNYVNIFRVSSRRELKM